MIYNELLFSAHIALLLSATCLAFFIDTRLLQALVCIETVCANIFVVKQMTLGGLVADGGGMYIVGSICGLLFLQEFVSKEVAYRTLYLSFGCALGLLLLSTFQLWYLPHPDDTMHSFFACILGRVPLITFFSLCAHFVSHYTTLGLSSGLQVLVGQRAVFFTNAFAMLTGQLIDSALFFGGVFWSSLSSLQIMQMMVVSLCVKFGMIALSSGLLWCMHRIRKERHV